MKARTAATSEPFTVSAFLQRSCQPDLLANAVQEAISAGQASRRSSSAQPGNSANVAGRKKSAGLTAAAGGVGVVGRIGVVGCAGGVVLSSGTGAGTRCAGGVTQAASKIARADTREVKLQRCMNWGTNLCGCYFWKQGWRWGC